MRLSGIKLHVTLIEISIITVTILPQKENTFDIQRKEKQDIITKIMVVKGYTMLPFVKTSRKSPPTLFCQVATNSMTKVRILFTQRIQCVSTNLWGVQLASNPVPRVIML